MIEEYYENYIELFATEGWKQFIKECQDSLETNNKVSECPNVEEFHRRKGIVEAYSRTCNLETFIRASMSLQEEEDANPV